MEYDDNGNIISCGSVVFEYDSTIKDKLVKANGQTVEYNDFNPFNPTKGNNKSYTWVGRRLTKVESLKVIVSYEYNEQGLRSKKTVNGVATKFYYDGDLLITQIKGTERLDFLYDENNMLYGFLYNNVKYFYVRDVLQNILGIIDETGTLVVKYDCDAWGNNQTITGTLATTMGEVNPFRYKGYYYDSETNMYYCKSRYYVPEWCRWLNADSIDYLEPESLSGMNLFAYCGNDPISCIDPSGHIAITLTAILSAAALGAIVGATSLLVTNLACNLLIHRQNISEWKFSSWQSYVGAAIGGAAGGVVSLVAGPVASSFVDGFISTSSSMLLENITGDANYNFGEIFTTSLLIGSFSGVTAGLFEDVTKSPKEMIENFVTLSGKSFKTKMNLLKQNILDAVPYAIINSITSGLVVSAY